MDKTILKYKLLIITLFLALTSLSQSFTTRLYTTADGLSDNYIFCVYQDSYGYVWTGTPNGLNRFDGKRFLNYGLKQGLPSLFVDKVYEDHDHRLWIGTRAGIAELKGDSCYTYPVSDSQRIYFVSGFLEPDPGRLWATTDKGLYELRNNTWIKIVLYPGHENNSIGRIIKTSEGLFINYDNNKLIQLRPDGTYNTLLSVQINHPYYNSLFQKNDTIYISTYSGLMYWDRNKWVPQFEDSLKKKIIYTSYRDGSGRFWLGTKEDGVLVITPKENEVSYLHIPLSFNLVSNFLEDRDKNIWVAGFQGLLKVSPSSYSVISLPEFKTLGSIRNCIAMPSGNLIVSGENGKLLIINPSLLTDSSSPVVATKQLKHPNDFIDFYTIDKKNRIWFTTRQGGLYLLDNVSLTDLTSIVAPKNEGLRGLAFNAKTDQIYVCGDSVLLVGNQNHLDTFFSRNNKKTIPIPFKIFIEKNGGSMLVQTVEDGLFVITQEGEVHSVSKGMNLSLSAVDKTANENIVWAAKTGRGISKYVWKNAEEPVLADRITEQNGLPDNYVLDLAIDKDGKIWIASTKGVTLMHKDQQGKWIHHDFDINEQGAATFLSFSKLSEDANNNMWMSLQDKLLLFDTKKTIVSAFHTETVIEKILLYDQPTNWSLLTDSVDSYRKLPVNPVLQHNQNTLSITFNGLQFVNNSLLEYSYRLQPSDTAWSSPTASNIVSFYQLAPGNYQFEVRSHIKGFDWSEPALFSFTIKKPFWETWWFRLAVILAASGIIVFIFRYRLHQLKERADMQNQVREMEMKALKAQMNPHFIHNALNSIQSLIINNKSTEASHYISKFAKLLRQVLESADKNLISLDKELYSLQLYVDLEKLRMNMNIDYKEQVDETIITSEIKIPPLILQPFVENALWHGLSRKEGNKKITISFTGKENWIICEITDNGIGRKKAAESYKTFPEGHLSKAVSITRQRLADFNQSPGTEAVSFIDNEEGGQPTGTTVIIRIKAR